MALLDQSILATDPTFQNRVIVSVIAACIAISTEAISVAEHFPRVRYSNQVLNNPANFKPLFAQAVATDPNVISDATTAGTVTLTAANVAAQAALVTDTHITAAVSGQFNAFFYPII